MRITWSAQGERLFHTGVDRGMLYTGNSAVPWSGLLSVNEAPAGGDPNPYYLDGRKVLNIPAAEEYGATVTVISCPPEFAPCAGRLSLSPALYVTDQPKQPFAFSYRTLIGNDVAGTSFAYKVHVVFNATAKISDFSHGTISDSPAAASYAFDIQTVPASIPGYAPMSHIVADTRLISSGALASIEAILYGDDSDDPRMPTPSELVTLLAS